MRYDTNEPKHFPPRRYTTRALRHARIAAKRAFLLSAEIACISVYVGAFMLATPDASEAATRIHGFRTTVAGASLSSSYVQHVAAHRCDNDRTCAFADAFEGTRSHLGELLAVIDAGAFIAANPVRSYGIAFTYGAACLWESLEPIGDGDHEYTFDNCAAVR